MTNSEFKLFVSSIYSCLQQFLKTASLVTVQHKNYLVAIKAVKMQEQNSHYQSFPGHRWSFQSDIRKLGRPRTSEATAEKFYVSRVWSPKSRWP